VVLPERDDASAYEAFYTEKAKSLPLPLGNTPLRYSGGQYINDFALFGWMVWEACLSEVARLNSSPVSAGCKGKDCGATDGLSHSAACIAEHAETVNAGGVDERAAFERHYHRLDLSTDQVSGAYRDYDTRTLWDSWQARAALSAPSQGEQVREWVPVSERTPGNTGSPYQVAAICKKRHDQGSVYEGQGRRGIYQDWVIRNWPGNFTHWLLLPAAPSAGSHGGDV
jgi:hypothetical protein